MTPSSQQRVFPLAPSNLKKRYKMMEVIGKGSWGRVRKCQDRQTRQYFACKSILKSNIPDPEILRREVHHLQRVHHSHLLRFEAVYEDEADVHIITELITGGELYDTVLEAASDKTSKHACFSEPRAATIVRQALETLEYMHIVHHLAHRDLKASNFMFRLPAQDAKDIVIIDFGLSKHAPLETTDPCPKCGTKEGGEKEDTEAESPAKEETIDTSCCCTETDTSSWSNHGLMQSQVGTPYYVAPEILTHESYTVKCDIWSIGVISYLLLSGTLPYLGADERETIKLLVNADVEYPPSIWNQLSSQAHDFCQALLVKDPSQRPTARQAMQHAWLVEHCGPAAELVVESSPPVPAVLSAQPKKNLFSRLYRRFPHLISRTEQKHSRQAKKA